VRTVARVCRALVRKVVLRAQTVRAFRRLARRAATRIRVREASAVERDAVLRVLQALPAGETPAGSADAVVMIAVWRRRTIGHAFISSPGAVTADPGTSLLSGVVVLPAFRRLGLGERLVLACIGWARAAGASTVWLKVEAGAGPAIGLYRKLGFVTVPPGESPVLAQTIAEGSPPAPPARSSAAAPPLIDMTLRVG